MTQHYIEPSPESESIEEDNKEFRKAISDDGGECEFPIRKARVSDVKQILALVNGFADSNLMLPRGPQYIYENIRDFVVAVVQNGGDIEEMIVACGSLHVLWEDMAEIRSVVSHPDFQARGLGRKVVKYIKEDAKHLGIKTLFTFTLAEEFFKTIGFKRKGKKVLPPKVWGECSSCPKYFKCDEIGMILEI